MKNGECNVVQSNVAKRRRRYLADIFTTMVISINFLLLSSYLIFIFVNKGGHSVALDGFDLHGQLHSQLARFCRTLVAYLLHARGP